VELGHGVEDVESIRAFAGERWEAVITPEEEQLLRRQPG
jgi:hypothetical protein